jgi:hypothetical protein
MPELPFDLRRRLLPTYLFLIAHSVAQLAIARELALEWGLELAALRLPRVGPPLEALLYLDSGVLP